MCLQTPTNLACGASKNANVPSTLRLLINGKTITFKDFITVPFKSRSLNQKTPWGGMMWPFLLQNIKIKAPSHLLHFFFYRHGSDLIHSKTNVIKHSAQKQQSHSAANVSVKHRTGVTVTPGPVLTEVQPWRLFYRCFFHNESLWQKIFFGSQCFTWHFVKWFDHFEKKTKQKKLLCALCAQTECAPIYGPNMMSPMILSWHSLTSK